MDRSIKVLTIVNVFFNIYNTTVITCIIVVSSVSVDAALNDMPVIHVPVSVNPTVHVFQVSQDRKSY